MVPCRSPPDTTDERSLPPSIHRRDGVTCFVKARFSQLALAGREVRPASESLIPLSFYVELGAGGAARSQTAHPRSSVSCSVHRSARRAISLGEPLPIPGNPGGPLLGPLTRGPRLAAAST